MLRNVLYLSLFCRPLKLVNCGLPIAICIPKDFYLVYRPLHLTFCSENIKLCHSKQSVNWNSLRDVETGSVSEQTVALAYGGNCLKVRRVVVRLKKVTRDGDWEIAILTSLHQTVASATDVAELYRGRWSIETLFQTVTKNFEGEIQTLGYPKAALFSFCLALLSYNILAVVRRALGSVHGVGKIE